MSITYPNTGVAQTESAKYFYPAGALQQKTDQNAQTTAFAYDSCERVSSVRASFSTGMLVRGRAELLRQQAERPSTPANIDNGKLLIFTPEDSLPDADKQEKAVAPSARGMAASARAELRRRNVSGDSPRASLGMLTQNSFDMHL